MEENKNENMTETLSRISEEQLEQLREHAPNGEIEFFFMILNYNFGDGEILPFDHILNIFQKEMFQSSAFRNQEGTNYLGPYIDCLRILQLLVRDTDDLKNIEKEDFIEYHDELVKEFDADASDALKENYINAVEPYKELEFENDNYKVGLIEDIDQLDWEGKYMNHCIATYKYYISGGHYIGFKFFNKNSWERLTLGFHRRGDELVFDQLKAHSNYPASKESCEFAVEFCREHNIECNVEMSFDLRAMAETEM